MHHTSGLHRGSSPSQGVAYYKYCTFTVIKNLKFKSSLKLSHAYVPWERIVGRMQFVKRYGYCCRNPLSNSLAPDGESRILQSLRDPLVPHSRLVVILQY